MHSLHSFATSVALCFVLQCNGLVRLFIIVGFFYFVLNGHRFIIIETIGENAVLTKYKLCSASAMLKIYTFAFMK
jgi:hypothetical protein